MEEGGEWKAVTDKRRKRDGRPPGPKTKAESREPPKIKKASKSKRKHQRNSDQTKGVVKIERRKPTKDEHSSFDFLSEQNAWPILTSNNNPKTVSVFQTKKEGVGKCGIESSKPFSWATRASDDLECQPKTNNQPGKAVRLYGQNRPIISKSDKKNNTTTLGEPHAKKKKPKPTKETSLFDFVSKPNKDARKPKQTHKTLAPEKERRIIVAAEKLDAEGLRQRGVGKKKKLTTLKKRLLQGRQLRSYLLEPHLHPIPLSKTPCLLGYSRSSISDNPVPVSLALGSRINTLTSNAELIHPVFFYQEVVRETSRNGSGFRSESEHPSLLGYLFLQDIHYGDDASLYHPSFFHLAVKRTFDASEISAKAVSTEEEDAKRVSEWTKVNHDSNFRDYVNQAFSQTLDQLMKDMIKKLFELQKRQVLRDPIKAKQRRRLVLGLREVKRGVKLRKVKCVILAGNIEPGMQGVLEGSIDERILEILKGCKPTEEERLLGRDEIPVIFAPSKSRLGSIIGQRIKVSAIGIYNFDGANEEYKKVMKEAKGLRSIWENLIEEERRMEGWRKCSQCSRVLPKTFYHCTNCNSNFCLSCKRSRSDRKIACQLSTAREGEDPVTCDVSITVITRSIPRSANAEEKKIAQENTVEEPKYKNRMDNTQEVMSASITAYNYVDYTSGKRELDVSAGHMYFFTNSGLLVSTSKSEGRKGQKKLSAEAKEFVPNANLK